MSKKFWIVKVGIVGNIYGSHDVEVHVKRPTVIKGMSLNWWLANKTEWSTSEPSIFDLCYKGFKKQFGSLRFGRPVQMTVSVRKPTKKVKK